jgi:hypothetical protein
MPVMLSLPARGGRRSGQQRKRQSFQGNARKARAVSIFFKALFCIDTSNIFQDNKSFGLIYFLKANSYQQVIVAGKGKCINSY